MWNNENVKLQHCTNIQLWVKTIVKLNIFFIMKLWYLRNLEEEEKIYKITELRNYNNVKLQICKINLKKKVFWK